MTPTSFASRAAGCCILALVCACSADEGNTADHGNAAPAAAAAEANATPPPPDDHPPWRRPALELGWPLALVDVAAGGRAAHLTLDADADALVLSIAPGVVTSIGIDDDFGRTVAIDHGDGLTARYGRLGEFLVHEGLTVVRGTAVGVPVIDEAGRAEPIVLEVRLDGEVVDALGVLGLPR